VSGAAKGRDHRTSTPATGTDAPAPVRKPRADGVRNRERLAQAAKAGFAETGPDVSLEEIARRAGVGIGTLYRHFPTRDAIIQAVYRREVLQLADAATRLLDTLSPGEALHEWMRLFVDCIATRKLMASALSAIVGGAPELHASSGTRISDAMTLLVERARASGAIRAQVEPADVLRALIGLTYCDTGPAWEASAHRLIDILVDGLRRPREDSWAAGEANRSRRS
jgi:AcrR family transcriptional regulator